MKGKLRICATCHSEYDFCPRCNRDKEKPLWYFTFCSSNCHDIYDITSKFEEGQINAKKAKAQLDKLNLSKLDNFGESYKYSINKIMSSVSAPVEVKAEEIINVTVTTDDTEIVSEEKIEATEEVVEEEKVFRKSRNKRAKNDVEE